ncbi:MAG: DUF5681 domain-containing protein [Pseudomonadota bacterium]
MAKFKSGESGNPKGRPRGSKNKFSTIRQSFLEAFEDAGGTKELTGWAKDNRKAFYTMIAKMLPKQDEHELKLMQPPNITIHFTDEKTPAATESNDTG